MAIQGFVTIESGGKVLMKLVAGCDGYKAQELADKLKESWPVTMQEAYEMALKIQFGCEDCLVIVTESKAIFEGELHEDKELDPLYRETFQQPRFNPRWKYGTADYVVVIDV